jgi:hypothetical protein
MQERHHSFDGTVMDSASIIRGKNSASSSSKQSSIPLTSGCSTLWKSCPHPKFEIPFDEELCSPVVQQIALWKEGDLVGGLHRAWF